MRDNSRAWLRDRLHRAPTPGELAIEVAYRYRGEKGPGYHVEAVNLKMRRLLREAKQFEYALQGFEPVTGRLPLPPAR